MDMVLLSLAIILMVITALLIIYFIFFEIYAVRTQSSTVSSSILVQRQIAHRVKALIQNHSQGIGTAAKIADLGAGTGGLAITVAQLCPQAQILAVELSPFPYFIGRCRIFLQRLKNIIFRRADLYTLDLRDLDVIISYLPQNHMIRLVEKLNREPASKPQTWISHYFFLPESVREADEVITLGRWYQRNIYIYRLP